MIKNKTVSNTVMLYLMTFAKLVLPLFTLPYLTRVLSKESYAAVSYVKNALTYIQLIVDFGFILSSVKDIARAAKDNEEIGKICGNTFLARFILSIVGGGVLALMCLFIEVLRENIPLVLFSFISVALTAFLADFLFRGIEKMHYITLIFVVSKSVSTALTFVFVTSDADVLWIPILDIICNFISVVMGLFAARRLGIKIRTRGISDSLKLIKDSFLYFLSSIATTAFSALNTLIIGIYASDELSLLANFSVCLSVITAIQNLYTPITNGIYPYMIKHKSLRFIHRILLIFMPIVVIGCVASFILARPALLIIGGEEYADAYVLFRWMIPILFFSFPAQIYGWPTLGAIGRIRQTTTSTLIAATVQILGLMALILTGKLDLISIAILRGVSEAVLMALRMISTYKNKIEFSV